MTDDKPQQYDPELERLKLKYHFWTLVVVTIGTTVSLASPIVSVVVQGHYAKQVETQQKKGTAEVIQTTVSENKKQDDKLTTIASTTLDTNATTQKWRAEHTGEESDMNKAVVAIAKAAEVLPTVAKGQ